MSAKSPRPIKQGTPIPHQIRPSTSASSESSSFISSETHEESCEIKRTPSSLMQEKLHHSRSTLKSRVKGSNPFKDMNLEKKHVYNIFKYFLVIFNGVIIAFIMVGVFIYFSEFREETNYKLSDTEEVDVSFSEDLAAPKSQGPRLQWLVIALAFAMLMTIPCLGFIGALKEHICLLVVYGVIILLQAVVILIFRSFWFLVPLAVAGSALGLVALIRKNPRAPEDEEVASVKSGSHRKNRIHWCMQNV